MQEETIIFIINYTTEITAINYATEITKLTKIKERLLDVV